MNKIKFYWFNLVAQLNALILPKDVPSEEIKDGEDLATMLAKLQAQVTELQNQAE